MKNYIIICKGKRTAKAKVLELLNGKQPVWSRSDRYTGECRAPNGDMYYWVTPSRNRVLEGIIFDRAYIECKTDLNSDFYTKILRPITKHESYFDGDILCNGCFKVREEDLVAIWEGGMVR